MFIKNVNVCCQPWLAVIPHCGTHKAILTLCLRHFDLCLLQRISNVYFLIFETNHITNFRPIYVQQILPRKKPLWILFMKIFVLLQQSKNRILYFDEKGFSIEKFFFFKPKKNIKKKTKNVYLWKVCETMLDIHRMINEFAKD